VAALAEGAAPFEPPETEDVSPALAGGPEPSPWAGPGGDDAETFARAAEAGFGGENPLERIADAVDEILEILREGRREQAGGAEAAEPAPAGRGRGEEGGGWVDLFAPGPRPPGRSAAAHSFDEESLERPGK
jgi:hypothetical protein